MDDAYPELSRSGEGDLKLSPGIEPAAPLWQRAPTRDEHGQALPDFMMIIPRLNRRSTHQIADTVNRIEQALTAYHDAIVFADLNLKLNVLWVTTRPRWGLCMEVAAAIHHRAPEALLVAHRLVKIEKS